MSKVQWTQPKLIVLTRGMPAESVLLHCKTQNPNVTSPAGPAGVYQHEDCSAGETINNCSNCKSRAFSDS